MRWVMPTRKNPNATIEYVCHNIFDSSVLLRLFLPHFAEIVEAARVLPFSNDGVHHDDGT